MLHDREVPKTRGNIDHLVISWAAKLIEAIREPGPYDAATINLIAHELSAKLPASS